jgi:methyl-accepting chemotaxis protein
MNLARSFPRGPGETRRQWYGLSLGVAGAIATWGANDWRWSVGSALASAALIVAGAVTDHFRMQFERTADDEPDSFAASTAQFGRDALPVWCGHIESSRRQMEVAAAELSQRFASIVARLDKALQSSAHGTGQGFAKVFEQSTDELRSVLDSLSEAMAGNHTLNQQVRSLGRFVDQLRSMAAERADLAAQTQLLSIKAAIEIAYTGDGQQNLSVLAQEVRKLSAISGETSMLMTQKARTLSVAIEAARQAVENSANVRSPVRRITS